jgi:hypothetical protein
MRIFLESDRLEDYVIQHQKADEGKFDSVDSLFMCLSGCRQCVINEGQCSSPPSVHLEKE